MQLFVKSAGFSINQDYSWMDEMGKCIELNNLILNHNVKDVSVIWKSTSNRIYILVNGIVDKQRVDMYNRPLRNYLLIEGNWNEADTMLVYFSNILLKQKIFESVLNNSVKSTNENLQTGFSVDFQEIRYFLGKETERMERIPLVRYLCEKDSYTARKKLLYEMNNVLSKHAEMYVFVGGELSEEQLRTLMPDRALLNNLNGKYICNNTDEKSDNLLTKAIVVAGGVAVSCLFWILISNKKR